MTNKQWQRSAMSHQRQTIKGDRLVASFHGEDYYECRLCGKTYFNSFGLPKAEDGNEYCPKCDGYGEIKDGTTPSARGAEQTFVTERRNKMTIKERLRRYIHRKHPRWQVILPTGQCLQCGADLAGTERTYLCEQCAPETECILRELYLDRPDCDDCVIKESEVNHP